MRYFELSKELLLKVEQIVAGTSRVLKSDLATVERNHNANDLLGYGAVFFLAAVGFACYEAAVKVLFQTIDFAFIEAGPELGDATR